MCFHLLQRARAPVATWQAAACRRHLRRTVSFHDGPGSSLSATILCSQDKKLPRPLSMVLAQLSLATHATQQFHTQLFHIQLSHPRTISLPPSPRNSHTLSHTQLTHTQPSHKQLSHAQLSRTYLFHTICLPSSPVSLLPFPSRLHLSFATYWKKLTCGVVRSFNFELDMMKQSTHGA